MLPILTQKLARSLSVLVGYLESRREHLWRLLQTGMEQTGIPAPITVVDSPSQKMTPSAQKTTKRTRRSSPSKDTSSEAQTNPIITDSSLTDTETDWDVLGKRDRPSIITDSSLTNTETETSLPIKRRRGKKTTEIPSIAIETDLNPETEILSTKTETSEDSPQPPKKKSTRRVGQRKPKRDPVG